MRVPRVAIGGTQPPQAPAQAAVGPDGLPILTFATAAAARAWLQSGPTVRGVWVKLAKKGNDTASVTYAQFLDEALCVGWIDGQKRRYDSDWFLQRFTPRRKNSAWSQVNREHVARLAAEGRMQPAGLSAVEAAKVNGRWEQAYAPASRAEVPADLAAALAENPAAEAFFTSLTSAARYAFLYRLTTVRLAQTRARKIEQYVTLLARHETLS